MRDDKLEGLINIYIFVLTKGQLGFVMPLFLPSFVFVSLTITVGLWSRPQSSLARFLNVLFLNLKKVVPFDQ